MCTVVLMTVYAYGQGGKQGKTPVSIIFDSDLGPDYDDVGALTLLHALADSGEAKIVATMSSNKHSLVAPCIEVINTYYGRANLPVGAPLVGANEADGHKGEKWTESLVAKYPHKIQDTKDVEDAVKVYRRLLAAAPDTSIVIVTVGFLTNVSDLLKSVADEYSPLDGKQLVAKKVHHLVSMAGSFPKGKEYNLLIDAKASDFIAKEWPTRILFLGGEIGCKILTGKRLIASDIIHTPAKEVFTICLAQDNPAGRCSWDQASTLIAVRGADRYFNTVKGHIVVNEDGSNTWIEDPNGTQEYVTEKMPWPELTKVIEDLMMHEPVKKTKKGQPLASLIPYRPSNAPDYFCTWNVQAHLCSLLSNEEQREAINERNIFEKGEFRNWADLYPAIRSDLYFVMDDSWDIPLDKNITNHNEYLGTTILDSTRFPSYKGSPEARLKKLVADIKSRGWKGAGGWICAQEATQYGKVDMVAYWTERLKAAHVAGFSYWKVDWGKNDQNAAWRKRLTDIGKQEAPNLWIEHAMRNEYIEFSDVFRTYDVEFVLAQTETVNRIAKLLPYQARDKAKGIINCEDEPYIAAGLGCAIGVMRPPFVGNFPDGQQDCVYPPVGRDMKSRLDEVVRGVRWHRIAEPFGVGGAYQIDTTELADYWEFKERESWVNDRAGKTLRSATPARVSRGLPLPELSRPDAPDRPIVLASLYPNGAVAVATTGRSLGREYITRRETITVQVPDITAIVGIFGDYEKLILVYPQKIKKSGLKILGQDLAGKMPVDITREIKIDGNRLIISGELIRKVGLMAATKGDKSDPGMVLKITN
ncbi:hypothetical protein AGMMS50239_37720 [Bacteroidia bacterium]|nr:hypothetical protein AGMMS50239_37720 [Bacteroidia bacterium]